MRRSYMVRVEKADGTYNDRSVNADGLSDARERFESNSPHRTYDWRGLVCFVDGARPAEEKRR